MAVAADMKSLQDLQLSGGRVVARFLSTGGFIKRCDYSNGDQSERVQRYATCHG